MSLLDIARSGDLPALRDALREKLAPVVRGEAETSLHDHLMHEALEYADAGDLAEAAYRLRLWHEPKWDTESACRIAYREAMKR